jgi:hypothetical protein
MKVKSKGPRTALLIARNIVGGFHTFFLRCLFIQGSCNKILAEVHIAFASSAALKGFSTSGFFHESVSPKPMSIPLGSFRILLKIRGDIHSSRFDTGVNDTGGSKCKKSSIIKVLII